MALTKNLKRTGMAARIEKEELRKRLESLVTENTKKRFDAAMEKLAELDPEGWEAWYDDDQNIPEEISWDSKTVDKLVGRIEAQIAAVEMMIEGVAQDEDWKDEQAMYQDLRHGG